jgi:hypothetical protein
MFSDFFTIIAPLVRNVEKRGEATGATNDMVARALHAG